MAGVRGGAHVQPPGGGGCVVFVGPRGAPLGVWVWPPAFGCGPRRLGVVCAVPGVWVWSAWVWVGVACVGVVCVDLAGCDPFQFVIVRVLVSVVWVLWIGASVRSFP